MSDLTVREAQPTDSATIADIWLSGWRDGHLGNVPDELLRARTPESFTERASERVHFTRVAVVNGHVVGFVTVVADEVEQVYVAEAARGAGVANILIADAERRIADAGYESAWLAVVSGNVRARRFYERNGWVDSGSFDYEAKDGARVIPVPCERYVKALV